MDYCIGTVRCFGLVFGVSATRVTVTLLPFAAPDNKPSSCPAVTAWPGPRHTHFTPFTPRKSYQHIITLELLRYIFGQFGSLSKVSE